jgi:hypothetical protein
MKPLLSCLTLASALLWGTAAHAASCEALSSEIEAKIRGGGLTNFTLTTVDAQAPASGKVVGTCDLGSKKIIYTPQANPAGPAPTQSPSPQPILTECRNGSVSMGGGCPAD